MCRLPRLPVAVLVLLLAGEAVAQRGVPQNGFPTWQERMLQVLFNRTRAEPTADPKACPDTQVRPPLAYLYNHNRAARFHSANLFETGCFQHRSPCLLHSDISMRFAPLGTCDGKASCACTNAVVCDPDCVASQCTQTFSRISLFGSAGSGEIIAKGYGSPRAAHTGWMNSAGHCAIILGGSGSVGTGWVGNVSTGNFASAGTPAGTLIAGGHEVGTSSGQFTSTAAQNVGFRVNYFNSGGVPQSAQLNVDGTCTPMTLERGTNAHGTWLRTESLTGTQCRRYQFLFVDPTGATVLLPETGSYGVGGALATCPDWSASAPPACGGSNAPPLIATAASASPNPVTGTTTQLSVLGADDGGEAALLYTWSATGPSPVSFAPNGTNAAKASTATFSLAGSYALTATVRDAGNQTATSTVMVTVQQTQARLEVQPPSATVVVNGSQSFTGTVFDQFDAALAPQPSLAWSVSGGGTIGQGGVFQAGSALGGPHTVTATSGLVSGTAQVTVGTGSPPTIAQAAAASPNPVTGTTTQLSVLGADDGGEGNLVYGWSGVGPGPVTFAANASNAAKTTTAQFSAAGSYQLQVSVADTGGFTATSAVSVAVQSTPATVRLAPASIDVTVGRTQAFGAVVEDQFGSASSPLPALAWTVSGGGTVSGAGIFTAGEIPGGPFTLTAAAGQAMGAAAVTVVAEGESTDLTPPSVVVREPSAGAELSGLSWLRAEASDDRSVARVGFEIDGVAVGTASAEPWELLLEVDALGFGDHELVAVARDAAGNEARSEPVPFRVVGLRGAYGQLGCAAAGPLLLPLLLLVPLALRRRRR